MILIAVIIQKIEIFNTKKKYEKHIAFMKAEIKINRFCKIIIDCGEEISDS